MDMVSLVAAAPSAAPWTSFVQEAAARFQIPPQWIWAVMGVESGGRPLLNGRPITSPVGAMGLMQLMPATWADLRVRCGLGLDPYDPHDNIVAGAAYLRQLYDRYGAPGFLAAYNAGPGRLDAYLLRDRRLPRETLNYLAAVGSKPAPLTSASPPPSVFVIRHEADDTVTATPPSTGKAAELFAPVHALPHD